MDFRFTDEQNMLRETYRRFAEKELTPEYVRWLDKNCTWTPDDLLQKLGELGTFGITIPEEYGGLGLGYIDFCLALEELAVGSVAVAFGAAISQGFGATPIRGLGTEEQKREHLPRIAAGQERWCMALTEPAGGTDILGAIRTTAVKDGDHYVINGTKMFITGAHVADYITTIAVTDKDAPRKHGLSAFMVQAQSPGITISLIEKVGNHATGACEVHFENVRVPAANLLGRENNGWYGLLGVLNPERMITSVFALGIAKAAFRYALQYAKEREAFGGPIGRFQVLQHYLADIAVEIENASNLIYKCAWLCDTGQRYDVEVSMAKIVSWRASQLAALYGMEILGGYGFTMEYDMQRHFRDYKQQEFAPITNEMAKNYIAQSFGLPRSY